MHNLMNYLFWASCAVNIVLIYKIAVLENRLDKARFLQLRAQEHADNLNLEREREVKQGTEIRKQNEFLWTKEARESELKMNEFRKKYQDALTDIATLKNKLAKLNKHGK